MDRVVAGARRELLHGPGRSHVNCLAPGEDVGWCGHGKGLCCDPNVARFPTTHWSEVQRAGGPDANEARKARESFFRRYWAPLHGYARKLGYDEDSAQDIVQGFAASLLRSESLSRPDAAKGRLRQYLLGGLRRHIAADRVHCMAQKRGGDAVLSPADVAEVASAGAQLDELYLRSWGHALLQHAWRRLGEECHARGQSERFAVLHQYLVGATRENYEAAALALGITAVAAKVAVHRLRTRFGQLVREEVLSTLTDPAELEDELQSIFSALQAPV